MTQLTEQEARQMIAVVNTRNVDKIVEQYADDATFQVPNMEKPLHGKESIRSYLSGSFVAFPDWTIDVSKVYITGNDVVVVNSVRGTQTGPLAGHDGKSIAPTNRKFFEDQMTRVVLNEGGKVQSFRAYGKQLDIAQHVELPK
ncbi:MAG: nuclear transport factor 2 family protein [Thermoplasmata archaeon]|nr:nuclear transport factor 2 family protein [Thermoplasmata archaeon]